MTTLPKGIFVQNICCSKLLDCGLEDPEEDKIGPPCFQRERFPCKHEIDKIHCTFFNYDIDDGGTNANLSTNGNRGKCKPDDRENWVDGQTHDHKR